MIELPTEFFRVQAHTFYDPPYFSIERWKVIRYTPKGCWIVHEYDTDKTRRKWVRYDGSSRWAALTKDEALEQLWWRKRAHLQHAKRRYKEALKQFIFVDKQYEKTPLQLKQIRDDQYLLDRFKRKFKRKGDQSLPFTR